MLHRILIDEGSGQGYRLARCSCLPIVRIRATASSSGGSQAEAAEMGLGTCPGAPLLVRVQRQPAGSTLLLVDMLAGRALCLPARELAAQG